MSLESHVRRAFLRQLTEPECETQENVDEIYLEIRESLSDQDLEALRAAARDVLSRGPGRFFHDGQPQQLKTTDDETLAALGFRCRVADLWAMVPAPDGSFEKDPASHARRSPDGYTHN